MENTIEEVNKKYERYTFLNQKFNEFMKKSYKIQKIFDLKEKQKLYDELWDEYGNLIEEYLDLDKFFTELNKQVNKSNNRKYNNMIDGDFGSPWRKHILDD